MPGLYAHTTRANGTTLTAAIYNADHENHITNEIPTMMDDYSANAAEMQTTSDPGEVGSESLATTLAGELERLRFAILEVKQKIDGTVAQWYATPLEADSSGRPPLPAWFIDGLEVRITTSSLTVVQVATGWCRSADDKVNIKVSTPRSRGLTALWASYVASGGGMCGVAVSTKAVYHIFAFKTLVSSYDIGGDQALNAANLMARASLGASDQHYRRIGSIIVGKVSGTAFPIEQIGREVYFSNIDYSDVDNIVWVSQSDGAGASLTAWALKTPTNIPMVPSGINVKAEIHVFATGGSATGRIMVFDGRLAYTNAPLEMMDGHAGNGPSQNAFRAHVWTASGGTVNVYRQVTTAAAYVQFAVLGWTDPCRE